MKHSALWICLALIGCGSHPPAPATPEPATPSTPVAEKAAEPAAPPAEAPAPTPPAADKSLYDRLGGQGAITAVVDEFVNRTTTDPRIKFRFFNTDPVNLKKQLVDFVCVAAGGPCTYGGRDMTTAHAGMDLAADEFTALVEDLVGAMDKFQVPAREKGEVLGALGPLQPLMVVSPDKLHPIPAAKLARAKALVGTIKDKEAADLLGAAITAGERGQRSYAEQLFSRAEIVAGGTTLSSAAEAFREGAPPRIHTALKQAKDTNPQPSTAVGKSEDERSLKHPERGSLHGTLQVEGKPLSGMGLVMLWPQGGGAPPKKSQFQVIEQRNKTFAPHLMAIPVGSTVAFPNFDSVYHNVFSLSQPQRFDLGLYKAGDMREVTFTKPGIVRLGCNIHANMSAYLVVIDAPHYVVADADGTFSFRSLKPGKYKVKAWSEQSSEPTMTEVTVKAGANEASIDLHGGAHQGPTEDKFGVARAQ